MLVRTDAVLSLQRLMEPAVVDPQPPVLGGIQYSGVTMPDADIGMVVGFAGMDGLRCNNVVSGHHHRERDVVGFEFFGVEAI